MVDLADSGATRQVLNIASGPIGGGDARLQAGISTPDGWGILRAVIGSSVAPGIVASVNDLLTLPETGFEVAWCSHVVEHRVVHEIGPAASEVLQILKPGDELFVFVPDLEAAIAKGRLMDPLSMSPAGPMSPHDVLSGHGASIAAGRTAMANRTGITPETLGTCRHAAGFNPVLVYRSDYEITVQAKKPRGLWSDPARSYVEAPC